MKTKADNPPLGVDAMHAERLERKRFDYIEESGFFRRRHDFRLKQQADRIMIENNLQPKPAAEESSGIGLENLRKRYELLHVQDGVTIRRTETKFSVTLKLL